MKGSFEECDTWTDMIRIYLSEPDAGNENTIRGCVMIFFEYNQTGRRQKVTGSVCSYDENEAFAVACV